MKNSEYYNDLSTITQKIAIHKWCFMYLVDLFFNVSEIWWTVTAVTRIYYTYTLSLWENTCFYIPCCTTPILIFLNNVLFWIAVLLSTTWCEDLVESALAGSTDKNFIKFSSVLSALSFSDDQTGLVIWKRVGPHQETIFCLVKIQNCIFMALVS